MSSSIYDYQVQISLTSIRSPFSASDSTSREELIWLAECSLRKAFFRDSLGSSSWMRLKRFRAAALAIWWFCLYSRVIQIRDEKGVYDLVASTWTATRSLSTLSTKTTKPSSQPSETRAQYNAAAVTLRIGEYS
jgi:hypothetical protein